MADDSVDITNEDLAATLVTVSRDIRVLARHVGKIDGRLNDMDLNGAAKTLREFGYFLRDNPSFMQRAVVSEDEHQDLQAFKRVIKKWTGWLRTPKLAVIGFMSAIVLGIAYEIGNVIYHMIAG